MAKLFLVPEFLTYRNPELDFALFYVTSPLAAVVAAVLPEVYMNVCLGAVVAGFVGECRMVLALVAIARLLVVCNFF